MGSLKEQLALLFKKGKSHPKVAGKSDVSDAGESKHSADSEDWKAGVEPLARRTVHVTYKGKSREPESLGSPAPKRHKRKSGGAKRKVTKPKPSSHPAEHQPKRTVRGNHQTSGIRPAKKQDQSTKPKHSKIPPLAPPVKPAIRLPESQIHDPPKTELSVAHNFHFPEDWVVNGSQLQPAGAGDGRNLSVRIGVDFGTAYTKAVVRLADAVFAIDFSGITNRTGGAFLLPGELSLDSSKRAWIGRHPEAKESISGLKIPFLTTADTSLQGKIDAALFLAWILRYTRAWIFRHQPQLLAGRTLAWELNVGIPSSSWTDKSLNHRYEAVVTTAWQLSTESEDPSRHRARELFLSKRPSIASLGLDDFRLVPEFVAQMAGYVLSSQRPEKGEELHLLVDVGAGTVDIACFGAYRPPNDMLYKFPTWASAVEPFGTHFLMKARCEGLGVESRQWDDFVGVPDCAEFAERFACEKKRVEEIDEAFAKQVSAAIGKVLFETKSKKNPMAREWVGGIRTFLVGGGSQCDVYRSAVLNALKRRRTPLKEMHFELMELQNRAQINHELMHRLSVAYGLAFDADSIGEAISPDDITDLKQSEAMHKRPDRDEQYPK